jgi:hypothetical protein
LLLGQYERRHDGPDGAGDLLRNVAPVRDSLQQVLRSIADTVERDDESVVLRGRRSHAGAPGLDEMTDATNTAAGLLGLRSVSSSS